MKKLICILASAALFGACEQKTEVTVPPASDKKADPATGQRPKKTDSTSSLTSSAVTAVTPATSTETKTESVTTEMKAEPLSTPNP